MRQNHKKKKHKTATYEVPIRNLNQETQMFMIGGWVSFT